MDALYRWEPTRLFITSLTGNGEVFLHEDPTNALVIQMYKPGCWTGWHFDRAVFTTIIYLSEPSGGVCWSALPTFVPSVTQVTTQFGMCCSNAPPECGASR